MAKTFLAGEAAVRLIPNSKTFHHTARRELAKEKIGFGVDLHADARGFRREAREALKTVKLSVDVKLNADITGFSRDARTKLAATRDLKVHVQVEARVDNKSIATAHAAAQTQLTAMGPIKVQVEASLDSNSVIAAHAAMQAQLRAMGPLRIDVEANRTAMDRIRGGGGGGGGGGRGGNGVLGRRKVRNAAIGTGIVFAPIATKAVVGGLSAIVGAASQAAGALGLLPAAATAAAAGFATLGIGLSGIAGAFKALGQQSAAGGNAAEQGRQAASAARAVEGASRGLAKAEKQVGRAQEDVTRAQKDLNKARKQAVRDLRDMNDELRKAPINEKQAALAIQQAQKDLQDAMKSGDSVEIQTAQLDLEEAKIDYDILIKQNQDLAADVAEANAAGVEGAENVVDAKLAVRDANDAVADAQDAVLDAQNSLTDAIEAQTAALEGNAAGVDAVAEAFAKLSPNAQDFVRKMQALGPAWTELRKAVQDRLFAGLGDDITKLAGAQLPTLKEGLEVIAFLLNNGVRDAIDVFSTPQAVSDFQFTLQNFSNLYAGIGASFAPLSKAFINVVTVGSEFMPRLGAWIQRSSEAFAAFTERTRADGSMQAFFDRSIEMAKQLGRILSDVGHILGDFFSAGAETGGGFLDTIETITNELRAFTESVEGQEAMKQFFVGVGEAVRTLAPIIKVIAQLFFETLGPALTDLVTAAGPGLVLMFQGLSDGLRAIAPIMTPLGEAIGYIFTLLGDIFQDLGPIIKQTLDALVPAIAPLGDLFASIIKAVMPLLPVIGQLIGSLVTALAPALTKIVEALAPVISTFIDALMPVLPVLTDMITLVADELAKALVPVIESLAPLLPMIAVMFVEIVKALVPLLPPLIRIAVALLPALAEIIIALMPSIQRLINIFVDLVNYLVPVLIPVIEMLADIIEWAARLIADILTWAIKNVVDPLLIALGWTLEKLGGIFKWLYEEIVKPVWDALGTAISWTWENIIEPAFDALMDGLGLVGDFFGATVDAIKVAWKALGWIATEPINFVIREVINGGIGKGWKAVDNFLGGVMPDWTDVPEIPKLPGMATGGMVPMEPGAVAGKDSVLRNLMPGEIVMSVPAVRALGAENLLAANTAAQHGGVSAQGMFPRDTSQMAQRIRSAQYGMEEGGLVRPDDPAFLALKRGHDWAASRDGRPYVLGGSADGGGGTDCSGFMSGIADVILGGSGARQWATMAFNGGGNAQFDSGPQGFQAGLAAGFSIGVTNGGPAGGHTAGTLGGVPGLPNVNVESGGSHGNVAYGGPAAGADGGFNTQYHLPIVNGEFQSGGGGVPGGGGQSHAEGQRRGITREAEKIIDGVLGGVKTLIDGFGGPPPNIKAVPGAVFDKTSEPMKKWMLDEISELTSTDGWRDKLKGTLDAMNPASWFDQGGVANGVGLIAKNTIQPERVLSPYETALFEGLLKVLGVFGIKGSAEPVPVDIQKVDGMPTTANTEGRNVIEGEAYDQPLQGAALDADTGEYLPADNSTTDTTTTATPSFTNPTETTEWKVAKSFADTFGFDKQTSKIEEKSGVLTELGNAVGSAAPAYMAALAGDPTQLLANIGTATTSWAANTVSDVSTFLPENAGGILESVLSGVAGPLIGTVNTGMSQGQLVEAMEDVSNRQSRRSKTGRSRRA
ncbi:tape measure protein [Nocardia phage NC1]|nr:tape measure protein [Nocardia phage NC1]QSL67735.1 tape measure protein [Nocardia phage P69]